MFWATIIVCTAAAFAFVWTRTSVPRSTEPVDVPVRVFLVGLLAVQLGVIAAILVLFAYAMVTGHAIT